MDRQAAAHQNPVAAGRAQPPTNCINIVPQPDVKSKKKKSGRHRNARNCIIVPWLSARKDNREGRFIQVGHSLLLSPEYQALTGTAKHLLLTMALESGGHSTVVYTHGTARKYGIPGSSYDRAINDLRAAGMVELLGEPPLPQYKPNCYKLIGVPLAQRK